MVEHVLTTPYHPRSNCQAERFIDTFKRAVKKAKGTPTDTALQQFLQVYWVTPNKNAPSDDARFARKIKSVFNKWIPQKPRSGYSNKVTNKHYKFGEKVIYCMYQNNKTFWKMGIIEKRIGNTVYLVKGPKFVHKRHVNQIKNDSRMSQRTTVLRKNLWISCSTHSICRYP